jgi:hypothetical protein
MTYLNKKNFSEEICFKFLETKTDFQNKMLRKTSKSLSLDM